MIKKIIAGVAAFVVVVVIIAMGAVIYSILRTPEEASAPIEAIPLEIESGDSTVAETVVEESVPAVEESEPQAEIAVEEPVVEEANVAEVQVMIKEETEPIEAEPVMEAETTETETTAVAEAEAEEPVEEVAEVSPILFEIVPAETEARFLIDEVLRGDPITVVGATDQAAGQFAVTPNNLSETQVGVIQINARTLATNNDFRNRAIKNAILLTDAYEFVTFTPTEIIGLSEQATIGETYNFQIVGDLTITDVTRQVTFNVTATPISENRIESTASTSFLYTDFELFIPDSPSVDTVADEVRLEINFVAEAIQQTS